MKNYKVVLPTSEEISFPSYNSALAFSHAWNAENSANCLENLKNLIGRAKKIHDWQTINSLRENTIALTMARIVDCRQGQSKSKPRKLLVCL